MDSSLPPDPYLALGVPRDANQAAIKTAHRKLVLKCHPDKVTDPAAKQAASDQFHKIQTAYEILVDEDRRARYDAQVRLEALKRERMEQRQGAKPSRDADRSAPSPYKSAQDFAAPRGSYNVRPAPQYEERRPSYAPDYFDSPPARASVRKEHEQDRAFRRPAADSKDKVRATSSRETKEKESEKERRREKARRAEQDTRRDRDRKQTAAAAYVEDDSDSDSDDYARRSRKMREEDEREKVRRARELYTEQVYKQQQQASSGAFDDRTRKMFAASAEAWDYIRSSNSRRPKPEAESRPAPVRQGSSKDKFDYVKGKDGRPSVVVRRPSERPKTSGRDAEPARRTSPKEAERRSSAENVSEARPPPTLNTSRSSPADIRTLSSDKPRAQSVQVEKESVPEIPSVKRAETMPYNTSRRPENAAPQRVRPTEFTEGLATPATTPEWTGPFAPNSTKVNYGKTYADDEEYPTPDGYRTEVRQPQESGRPKFTRKVTKSPSPVRETREVRESRDTRELPRERPERSRTASSRYPETTRPSAANMRTTSTSYVYTQGSSGVEPMERSQANTSRGVDSRDPRSGLLYAEVRPASGSPRQKSNAYPAPEERYRRTTRPEEIRVQSGYTVRKPSADRPSMNRSGSGNAIYGY